MEVSINCIASLSKNASVNNVEDVVFYLKKNCWPSFRCGQGFTFEMRYYTGLSQYLKAGELGLKIGDFCKR